MASDEVFEGEQPSSLEEILIHIRSLSKDVLIYGFAGTLSRVLSIFTAPILTRIFSVADYGVVSLISTTTGFFVMLLGFNLTSGMWRYYYEIPENEEQEQRRLVSSTFILMVLVALPVSIFLIGFGRPISILLFSSETHSTPFRLALLSMPSQLLFTFAISLLRMRRQPIPYMILNIAHVLVNLLLVVTFVVVLRMGITGIYFAQIIAFTSLMIVGLYISRDLFVFAFSKPWLIKVMTYSLPQLPGVFVVWLMVSANRYFLNYSAGVEQVGLLSIANKVAAVLVIFTKSFRLAWDPFALSIIKSPNFRVVYSKGLQYYLSISLILGTFITAYSKEILYLIAPEPYWSAATIVGILVFRYVLQGANNIVGISIAVSKKTIYSSLALTVAAIATIIANLLLTNSIGVYGAALSEMIGFLIGFAALLVISYRIFPISWPLGKVLKLFLGFVIVYLLSIYINQITATILQVVILKFVLIIGFSILVLMTISREEREIGTELIAKQIAQVKLRVHEPFSSSREGSGNKH